MKIYVVTPIYATTTEGDGVEVDVIKAAYVQNKMRNIEFTGRLPMKRGFSYYTPLKLLRNKNIEKSFFILFIA